jgi:hypothetical protein
MAEGPAQEFASDAKADPFNEKEALANSLPDHKRELAELREAATLGMASLAVAHDLGNSLNSMLLQASIIEMQASEDLKEKVAVIRAQGAQAAAVLRPLQRVRLSGKQSDYPVDMNSIVRQVLEEQEEHQAPIEWRLSEGVTLLHSTRSKCLQLFHPLCVELLRQATTLSGLLIVETTTNASGRALTLTVTGPGSDPASARPVDALSDMFLADMGEIERLSVQSLVKQHEMEMQFQRGDCGYQKLTVRWQ